MEASKKITIVGSGYVGYSLALLLSQNNEVSILDSDEKKLEIVKNNLSPISDTAIDNFLASNKPSLKATNDLNIAYNEAEFIIVATPTDYDVDLMEFDTSSVEQVINDALSYNDDALIVIKSTIPVGFTNLMQEKFKSKKIVFSPEFLREGMSLIDNLHPSRIIVGGSCAQSKIFATLLSEASDEDNIPTLFMDSEEAESVKLFSNAYLAMRVSFFNELDSYALVNNLNSKSIIEGVSLDKRIGKGYNNPSFGYGGYCFPKDTKQLLASYKDIPQSIISAIVKSNDSRKDFLVKQVLLLKPSIVGIHRLIMKSGSDNFRSAAITDIMNSLKLEGVEIILYEPLLDLREFESMKVFSNLNDFKKLSDVILCNRFEENLSDVQDKIFTRDIFGDN